VLSKRARGISRWFLVIALVVVGAIFVAVSINHISGFSLFGFSRLHDRSLPAIQPTLRQAREHFARGEFAAAERIARTLVDAPPHQNAALLLAGEAATRQGRPDDALQLYAQISPESKPEHIQGLWAAGGVLLHLGRISESEQKFREVLKLDPKNEVAHRNLAFILSASGRRHESLPHLLALVKLGIATMEDLLFLGNPVHTIDYSEFLNFASKVDSRDPLPTLGLASVALYHNQKDEARNLLRQTLQHGPQLAEAHALLGRLHIETNDVPGMQEWNSGITPQMEWHPEIWFVRGIWAQEHNEIQSAIRCYWEALRRNPDHARANYRLGQLLVGEGHTEWAKEFSERAEKQ
jgi:tetratricopeptide (TPR) repeat protein